MLASVSDYKICFRFGVCSYQEPVLKGDQVEVDQLGGGPDLPVGKHNVLVVPRQPLLNLLRQEDLFISLVNWR